MEDEQALVTLRARTQREVEKGAAVRRQRMLYDRSLEMRILLQKCVAGANQMPPPATRQQAVAAEPQVQQGYEGLAAAAAGTLTSLLELQAALMDNYPGRCQALQSTLTYRLLCCSIDVFFWRRGEHVCMT